MRGFLVNPEMFLNTSGEEVLFDREMGQLNETCTRCSEAEMKIKLTAITFRFTNKTRTSLQYVPWISIPFIQIKNWTFFVGEVHCDSFSDFFNRHRPRAKGQPLQERPGVGMVFFVDCFQDSVIDFV
jgi:hypothetical protein